MHIVVNVDYWSRYNKTFDLNGVCLQFTDVYDYLDILLDKNMTLIPLLSKKKKIVSLRLK